MYRILAGTLSCQPIAEPAWEMRASDWLVFEHTKSADDFYRIQEFIEVIELNTNIWKLFENQS